MDLSAIVRRRRRGQRRRQDNISVINKMFARLVRQKVFFLFSHENISVAWRHSGAHISERSSSTKLKLNESTKRNAWLNSRDTSSWRSTNSEECDVIWRNQYFCFVARLASLLLKPWCIMIEQGDTTRPAVDFYEPSESVKE